jgi:MFS family permease
VSARVALRYVWPLLLVTLVNKMASLALSLLPALLVEREVGVGAAALAMGVSRAASIGGTLLSGLLADRFGLKPTLVGSLILAGAGGAAMILDGPLLLLVAGASLAQTGMGMFPMATRLLLVSMVPVEHQRVGLAWQRTTANGGLILAFTMGALLGEHVGLLLALDAGSSLLAAALAWGLVPATRHEGKGRIRAEGSAGWGIFLWATLLVGWWNLTYEAYLTATAAQLRLALGPDGVSWYSTVMILNVVGCTALGLLVARWIDEPRWSIPAGMLLLLLGAAVGVARPDLVWQVAAGMALATAGELVFTATSQFVWMTLVPASPRQATVFSAAMTFTFLLRATGAALAFPLVVDAPAPALSMLLLGAPGLLLALTAAPVWRAFREVGGVT